MSDFSEDLKSDLDALKERASELGELKSKVNLILREKIEEYENETALIIDMIQTSDNQEFDEVFNNVFWRMKRTTYLLDSIRDMTQNMPAASKN